MSRHIVQVSVAKSQPWVGLAPLNLRLTACLFAVAAVLFMAGLATAKGAPDSFADLADRLSPAVVNISTTQSVKTNGRNVMPQLPPGSPFEDFFRDFFDQQRRNGGQPRRVTSLGSGFIVGDDGYVVTNNHVIAEADEITVRLSSGEELEAEIVGRDVATDVALLKVETDEKLPFVSFGDSDTARVGDWVVAIGNPFGLGGTVTAGIVSARNRVINAGRYDDFIQTDASINRGNSGGPMFNLSGEVIGMNTAIFSPTGGSVGIGFAIPSNLAKVVVSQLREFGETRRGWLGVRIQSVNDEIAESLGMEKAMGALIAGLTEGGPAEEAGLEQGDVIIEFDGKEIAEMRALPLVVAETPIGKTVSVEVWRRDKKHTFKVEIGRLEEEQLVASLGSGGGDNNEVDTLGMTLSRLGDPLRQRFNIEPDVNGVVITDIDSESLAFERGIRPGDVIMEVAQQEVSSPQDVVDKVREVQESDRHSVLLLLESRGVRRFVGIRLNDS